LRWGFGDLQPGTLITEELNDALTRLDGLFDRMEVSERIAD
jgi:hypothetical protein